MFRTQRLEPGDRARRQGPHPLPGGSIVSTGGKPPQGPHPAAALRNALRAASAAFFRPSMTGKSVPQRLPLDPARPRQERPPPSGKGVMGAAFGAPPSSPPTARRVVAAPRSARCGDDAWEMRWWLWVGRTLRNNHSQRTRPRKRFAGSLGSPIARSREVLGPRNFLAARQSPRASVVRPRGRGGPKPFRRRRSAHPRSLAPSQAASGHRPGRRS
jgi:hypothetical protein